jgi:hypothetical protein
VYLCVLYGSENKRLSLFKCKGTKDKRSRVVAKCYGILWHEWVGESHAHFLWGMSWDWRKIWSSRTQYNQTQPNGSVNIMVGRHMTCSWLVIYIYIYIYIICIIISIQPLDRFWQEPKPSQATGMALARCILGMFWWVVCHCFPLPLDVPTFAARCLHVPINPSAPSSERWNCGREWSSDFAEMTPFLRHLGIFYMPQICDMGQTALFPFRRKACWGFFSPEKSDGFGRERTRDLGYKRPAC